LVFSRLKEAGLPVVVRDQAQRLPGRPRLLLLIGVLPEPFCGMARLYEIELDFQEDFTRVRPPARTARRMSGPGNFNS
jgi:hypothetical protein